jgi:hypothetical protein
MNSSITFSDKGLFLLAVTTLELDATPSYDLDFDNLTIHTSDIDGVVDVLHNGGVFSFKCHRDDAEPSDGFLSDAEADGDALKSAGWGTDEDYDHYSYDNE